MAGQSHAEQAIAGTAHAGLIPQPDIPVQALPVRHCANPSEYPSQGPLHVKLHINQLKGARGFSGVAPQEKDANGYPRRLTDKPAMSRILDSAPDLAGVAPYAGRFRLYGRGTGAFRIAGAVQSSQQATLRLPRETLRGETYWYADFDYDPRVASGRVRLQILDLPVPDDHLRDLALVHHSHLDAWRAGEIFMPEVISDLALFGHGQAPQRGALRFMQALQVNAIWTPGKEVSPRTQTTAMRERRFVTPQHYSYVRIQNPDAGRGHKLIPTAMPIEDIVALSNATGTDLWYNLSADITDARATSIATYVRDYLDPALKVYWEYGNELWNSARGFASYRYAREMGMDTFPHLGEVAAVYEWDVYRSMQLFSRIRDIFGTGSERSRFVASFWAIDGSNRDNGRLRPKSYAGRYFAAADARLKPDIGALPEEIITDMAVGGYFGNPFGAVADWLNETYPDDWSRAAAFMRILEHGLDGMQVLRPALLDAPVMEVPPETDIAAHALLRRDIAAGLDPWRDLPQVLRLQGNRLQYRGKLSSDWRDVLHFTHAPVAEDVAGMMRAGQLMGVGRRFYGENFEGFNSQLRNALRYRVMRHAAFARAHGLAFHFYEGGANTESPPGEDPQATRGFADAYQHGGWAARAMALMLERAAPELAQICWYKSHNRFANGYWGLKRVVGQDPAETPKWAVVAALIAAGR